MENLNVDLWAINLQRVSPDLETWLREVEQRLADAAQRGVHLVVLPEFACAQWFGFKPGAVPEAQHLAWLAKTGEVALGAMKDLVLRYGVSLVPGTIPFAVEQDDGVGVQNRAWLLTPDGGAFHQNKLSLTPLEAQGGEGVTYPGETVNVIVWNGLRVAIAVCLDAEYTALWSRLGGLNLDLVIVPAKTDMVTGFNRVFGCARARAIELQTVVCAVGAVGAPLAHPACDTGIGGAAVYLPCDVSVSLDGVHAVLPPLAGAECGDRVLAAVAIPVGACRALRGGGAEAELRPGQWRADHLGVRDGEAA